MIESVDDYVNYIKDLKKDELINIINDYNELTKVFNKEEVKYGKLKKDKLVSLIMDIKDDYYKFVVMSLDIKDYELLKQLLKKNDEIFLTNNSEFIKYLKDKHILWQKDNLVIPNDIKMLLSNLVKNKEVINYIKKWDRIYKLVAGLIVAYGVVDTNYFNIVISGIVDKELIVPKINYYYKRDYLVTDKMLVSKKLSNKKRINKYYHSDIYQKFTNKEYVLLGSSLYHHNIKVYKKFIKMLKNNYVFSNKDIDYVDKNIVIPYLYNSLNEEDIAKKNLEETVTKLFEFKGEKLKKKMLERIMAIRLEFPLWEYRGFTKMEVENE